MEKDKRSKNYLKLVGILLVAVMVISLLCPIGVKAETSGYKAVEDIDFSDFSSWRSGDYYYSTGKYGANEYRICLNNYVTFQSKKYTVFSNNSNFHLLIRELDSNMKFIKSYNLSDGASYVPGTSAKYLAISVYKTDWEKGVNYAKYESMFSSGFSIGLKASGTIDNSTVTSTEPSVDSSNSIQMDNDNLGTAEYDSVEEINFKDFNNWRSGCYNYTTGKYEANNYRLCLNEYVTFKNDSYKVVVTNESYQLLVRELDKNKKFLKSNNMKNGTEFTPGSNTVYLAIGIYKATWETDRTYDKYKSMFADGFYAALVPTGSEDILIEDTITSTKPKYSSLREEMKDMLENGDMTTHDISRYSMTFSKVYAVYQDLIDNDCYLAYKASYGVVLRTTKNEAGIVQSIYLENMDEDFVARYQKMKDVIDEALSGISGGMKDVEKALVLHDYEIEHAYYSASAENCRYATAALVDGQAVCAGFSNGLLVLLHEAGIESYYISGNSGNHAWVLAKLDGYWYHIDSTWDDSRTRKWSQTDHQYFVCNDTQFLANGHANWVSYEIDATSTSTLYEDWFVHDVVGKMLYYKGIWYFVDQNTNSIMGSNIEGTNMKVIVDGSKESATISINSIENGILTYYIGTSKFTKNL